MRPESVSNHFIFIIFLSLTDLTNIYYLRINLYHNQSQFISYLLHFSILTDLTNIYYLHINLYHIS